MSAQKRKQLPAGSGKTLPPDLQRMVLDYLFGSERNEADPMCFCFTCQRYRPKKKFFWTHVPYCADCWTPEVAMVANRLMADRLRREAGGEIH